MSPEWLAKVRREPASAARPVLGVFGQESVPVAVAATWPARPPTIASRDPPTTIRQAGEARVGGHQRVARPVSRLRDAASEAAFFEVYGNMLSLHMADEREEIRRSRKFDPRSLPAVREVLDTIDEGSAIEGLARIAMLITKAGRAAPPVADAAHARDPVAGRRYRALVRGRAPPPAAGGDHRRRVRTRARQALAAQAAAHARRTAPCAGASRPDRAARRPRRQAARPGGRVRGLLPARDAQRRQAGRTAAAEAQATHARRAGRRTRA